MIIRNIGLAYTNIFRSLCYNLLIRENMAAKRLNEIEELEEKIDNAEAQVTQMFSNVQSIFKDIRRQLINLKYSNENGVNTTTSYPIKRENGEETISSSAKKLKYTFDTQDERIVVYTDGACTKNGKSGAKAGIGVWWGENHPLNVSKPCLYRQTNNAAEIQACTEACMVANTNGIDKLLIKTDSQFVINCMTMWIKNWKKNNWRTQSGQNVINKSDLLDLEKAMNLLEDVRFEHVKGHRGVIGNEEADKLAVAGASK